MLYKINNNSIMIPDDEIEKNMKKLKLTKKEAIELWLDDNNYLNNEEQDLLDNKAKQVKISREAVDVNRKKVNSSRKPYNIKVSDEKKELFNCILGSLNSFYANNVTILKENKRFEVKIGEKSFCVDIVEHRQSKK